MKKSIFALIVSIALTSGATSFAANEHYAVVVDAGSSGSRVHLFEYTQTSPNAVPVIQDVFSEKVTPGLSAYADKPKLAGESLKQLLDDTVNQLQAKGMSVDNVPFYVFATAGMRLLPLDVQQPIYNNVRRYAQGYHFKSVIAETITGTKEGIYGWLDVNYLAHNFTDGQETIGSLDMGGASTQIAFATLDKMDSQDEVKLKIGGQEYRVFSKSFLGLGLDQSRAGISSDHLATECYPQGYFDGINQRSFDFNKCSLAYENEIDKNNVSQEILPLTAHHFIAYSGIYTVDSFFKVKATPEAYALENSVDATCDQSWDSLKAENPTTPEKYLSTYCANGVYIYNLLYNAYKLNSKQLAIKDKVDGQGIDWTLGALLYTLVKE